MVDGFAAHGWRRFGFDAGVATWAATARRAARRAARDPGLARWHVCAGTWFVGVDALGSDAEGRVAGSPALAGPAMAFLRRRPGVLPPLDRGQVSAVYPGYPKPREGESAAAFRYRRRRDAAHLDGLKPALPGGRRCIAERHAFILGLPLTDTDPGASPLVVWEGSHEIMRAALSAALADDGREDGQTVDLTDAYTAARRCVFETCRRVELHARPGEALLVHRLALHGVAPWAEGAQAPRDGRVIAYFRPPMPGSVADWLTAP